MTVLQSKGVAYRGQVIACVVAESLETAREASQPVNIDYDEHPIVRFYVKTIRVCTSLTAPMGTSRPTRSAAISNSNLRALLSSSI